MLAHFLHFRADLPSPVWLPFIIMSAEFSVSAVHFSRSLFENACTFSTFSCRLAVSCLAPFYYYERGISLFQQCTSAGVCFRANLPSPVWLPFIITSAVSEMHFIRSLFPCQLAVFSLAPFYYYEWGISLFQQCTSAGVCFRANLPSPVWFPFIITSGGFLCLSNALYQEFVFVPTCRLRFGSLLLL